MKKKINSNICFFFEEENGKCKHYGGKENILEACFHKCKKIKKKRANQSKSEIRKALDACYTGIEIE